MISVMVIVADNPNGSEESRCQDLWKFWAELNKKVKASPQDSMLRDMATLQVQMKVSLLDETQEVINFLKTINNRSE